MKSGRARLFDDPRNLRRVLRLLYAVCAGLLAADLVYHRHAVHPWESHFGFYALYGFVACVALVLLAKELRKLVMRAEDYYDQGSKKFKGSDPLNPDSRDLTP